MGVWLATWRMCNTYARIIISISAHATCSKLRCSSISNISSCSNGLDTTPAHSRRLLQSSVYAASSREPEPPPTATRRLLQHITDTSSHDRDTPPTRSYRLLQLTRDASSNMPLADPLTVETRLQREAGASSNSRDPPPTQSRRLLQCTRQAPFDVIESPNFGTIYFSYERTLCVHFVFFLLAKREYDLKR